MAQIITVIHTCVGDDVQGASIELEIPKEAADIINKYWHERGIKNCTKSNKLKGNQFGTVNLLDNEHKLVCGLSGL